ncbi:hypothetical protein CXG81DRAFT_12997 [Caulochytrium protostelioides]|uniref:Electron transfer flavoprotein-ubiquinone oxidoreductase n=1 Tax=Caulochytrium protostelioides TaxID=1555241 RepID=A0A4P9WX12_9FUNG|nr:electron transfer flavo protein-ubiquinone oxidoreductase [Caulochytrium protostelioides]RKP00623.1 hypothetical protein CXG81DRAFT_12997 [Caulochytrium protostelioides]|eukprot:RKP00623.1 hypothetical protein CXG81DRAFT_12997 [Caulochytrium protostelioides]
MPPPPASGEAAEAEAETERFSEQVDVCIVGAGPAGLSAAIRIRQLAIAQNKEIRVFVVEKGAEVGSHIISGNVLEPGPLWELFPDWKERNAPLIQKATTDKMYFLTESSAIPIPHPPQMHNRGNYIVSLNDVVRWLGEQAEELGVEIYPSFAGAEILYHPDGSVKGVATGDMGIAKNGTRKDSFEPGMEIHAKVTLFAEGAHGSLTKKLIRKFDLRKHSSPQTYGLGLKEVWKLDPAKHQPGLVMHAIGWPMSYDTYGGSFMYHGAENTCHVGLVVGLDYKNPYIRPYSEFQRMKHHPVFAKYLEGGELQSYGARTLNEGGLQSIPKLTVPGAALLGCAAGFLNVPKIKGTHNAMRSGMIVAEEIMKAASREDAADAATWDVAGYEDAIKQSSIWKELHQVRNVRPSFNTRLGLFGGVAWSGLDTLLLRGHAPFTFRHDTPDYAMTEEASKHTPIEYPKPDGKLSFALLDNVARTGTGHEEDQPVHLRLKQGQGPHLTNSLPRFAGIENKFCPAGVYEYVDDSANPGQQRFQINASNCIHCKTCDIKDPNQNIDWTVPEGGGGPKYVGL